MKLEVKFPFALFCSPGAGEGEAREHCQVAGNRGGTGGQGQGEQEEEKVRKGENQWARGV